MVNLYIDNIEVSVAKNSTVLQACDSLGIDIPRFCFHERLLIAGNCRMCLVEIEKSPKPVASCALPVMEGMKVFTNTPLVKKAQEGVLEFLLLNHPLDCPICDQGGECDLQDQAMFFGSDSSRFYEYKRGVEDKNCGPLIKTIMTRCIHCTRCVRFSTEIAGVPELGTLGRGTHTQIGTFVDKTLSSELSGNMIDLCPVGALTSKPYAFKARSWELQNINSIDTTDSCGSNIVISTKGNEVMRILPRLNENINEEWISDKGRFSYDGLKIQRLGIPLVLNENGGKEVSWEKSFEIILSNIFPNIYNLDNKLNVFLGKETDLESALVLKEYLNKLNCFSIYTNEKFDTNSLDIFYKFDKTMKSINNHDLCILVNCDTRFESSMLNLHLRKAVRSGSLKVGFFGKNSNLTYDANHLGLDKGSFINFIKGKHLFSKELKKSKNPLFVINPNSFDNKELLFIDNILKTNLKSANSSINILNLNASSVGLKDLGFKSISDYSSSKVSNGSVNLYVGTDFNKEHVDNLTGGKDIFSVYLGTHGLESLESTQLILPGKSSTEKQVSFMNLEGLVQNTAVASSGLGNSREEWKIFNAFFEYLSINSGHEKLLKIKFFDCWSLNNYFKNEFKVISTSNHYNKSIKFNFNNEVNSNYINKNFFYKSRIKNFYKTNIVTAFSQIMSECSANIKKFNFNK